MREEAEKYALILAMWILFGFGLWAAYKQSQLIRYVEENGIEVRAKVIDRHYTKGWSVNVEYYCNNKKYDSRSNVYKFVPEIGDSLIVKILANSPDTAIIVKSRVYAISPKS